MMKTVGTSKTISEMKVDEKDLMKDPKKDPNKVMIDLEENIVSGTEHTVDVETTEEEEGGTAPFLGMEGFESPFIIRKL